MENNNNSTEKNTGSTNYELKSKAVEELLEAESGEAPEYSQEELNKYLTKSRFRVSDTVKILFIKGWFAGAVCFFFIWGLSMYIPSMLDMLFVVAVMLGMVNDILVNNVLRFIEKEKGESDRWMMYPKKGMASFFLNIIHGFAVVFCVYLLYYGINFVLTGITGNAVELGVEPILFGIFSMVFDVLLIWIKHLLMALVRKAVDRN